MPVAMFLGYHRNHHGIRSGLEAHDVSGPSPPVLRSGAYTRGDARGTEKECAERPDPHQTEEIPEGLPALRRIDTLAPRSTL